MSEQDDDEVSKYLSTQNDKMQKQYRGVMICQQPQRWQYSIEQIGVINDQPHIKNQKEKEGNALLVKQEKKLLRDLKRVRLQNKDNLASLSTINDDRSCITGLDRCSSVYSNRQDEIDKQFLGNRLRRGISYLSTSDEQNSVLKRSTSRTKKLVTFQNEGNNLKQKFDEYNKAVLQMNKQQKEVSLPKIFDENKQNQIEIIRTNSCNRRKVLRPNQFYPHEIYSNQDKQLQVASAMKEQESIVKRIISKKLDPEERKEIYDQKEFIDMEMLDPISMSQFNIKNMSPLQKRKIKAKRIKSAKEKSPQKEQSPQQRMQKDVKQILQYKSDLNNLYFKFMSKLKVIK